MTPPPDDQTTFAHTRAERAAWMAAKGRDRKLAAWMREALNAAASATAPPTFADQLRDLIGAMPLDQAAAIISPTLCTSQLQGWLDQTKPLPLALRKLALNKLAIAQGLPPPCTMMDGEND